MHSIVIGDLIKYIIMTVGCIAIGIIAMIHLNGIVECSGRLGQSIFWMASGF